jgi:pimeloyl-ACP methyl ester carboxylesterase
MLQDIERTDPNCREQFAAHFETQPWVNEIAVLQKTQIPFLYILGQEDGFINTPFYKELLIKAGIPESSIQALEGVRHIPHVDAPEVSAKLIKNFVRQH